MSKIFYPTAEKLSFLLLMIHNKELGLPDFQRDFVWDPRATEELIESIFQNFPAGSLLRIKNRSGFHFVPREFEGAPKLDGQECSYLILDGQQRLTSLYQALYGTGNHRYFADLSGLIAGKDLEDCIFYLRRKEARKSLGTIESQAEALICPLEQLFGSRDGFDGWRDAVVECRVGTEDEKKELRGKLREVQKKWLKTLEDYEFPMVTLADDTSSSAVCTIFETLNRTGVKLTAFDLLAARFWTDKVRLRDLWDAARQDHAIIEEFDIDPYYVLQSIALVTARAAPSCKRSDVLDLDADQIRRGWEPVVRGLAYALELLREDCGVLVSAWLPYNTMLIPLAAVASEVVTTKGPAAGAARINLKRWFWCSVFGQKYETSPNSQAARDFGELRRWLRAQETPETVARLEFDESVLRQTTPRQRGLYRGTMALILSRSALDFHKARKITPRSIADEKMDDHHIFPEGFLRDSESPSRDCILNRTLIDRRTNILIGKNAPSVYLSQIDSELGGAAVGSILASHLIPADTNSALRRDDFSGFLAEREKLLLIALAKATSGQN